MEVEKKMRFGFKSIWLQRPDRWTFFGSMFFCCTVFTTVGKSHSPHWRNPSASELHVHLSVSTF